MKRISVLLFINLVLVLFQTSFFGPNLVLALAFAFAFSGASNLGKASAFLGGLLLDILGFNIIGFSPIILISCIIMYDFVRKNVSRNLLVNGSAVFLSAIIYDKILLQASPLSGAFLTLLACGIFYLVVSNVSGYFLRSGYKLSDED